jgi:chemotaxis protein MotA
MHALPYEMMAIGGRAWPRSDLQQPEGDQGHLSGFGKVFAGAKWKPADYRDLLSLLFQLTKTMKTKGVIAPGEPHREAGG